ncbi:MAG: hypothetical protein VCD66_09395 [Alphaproteobacteria bacterium]
MTLYPYADGDLIEAPNSYFYSRYDGLEFLTAWRQNRAAVLEISPEAAKPPPVRAADPASRQSAELLERAMGGDDVLREAFVKKFEIHKRVHDGYDEAFRALDISARRSYPLYLRAADLFAACYEESGELRHLNVYLKCLDTLCSRAEELSAELLARLAWHLRQEQTFIETIIEDRRIVA